MFPEDPNFYRKTHTLPSIYGGQLYPNFFLNYLEDNFYETLNGMWTYLTYDAGVPYN